MDSFKESNINKNPKETKKKSLSLVRLHKHIADCGVTSRRKAEKLIINKRVKVNGEIVSELGLKINPLEDIVDVDGIMLDKDSVEKIYLVLNKPRGYITSLHDPEGRPTVLDFVKDVSERIYPVGRLDYLSEGLLILTNDGDVANHIAHPKFEIIKVYEIKVFGIVTQTVLSNLRKGFSDNGVLYRPMSVRIIGQLPNKTWLEVRLSEGKNREIRRICEYHGVTIDKLRRVSIGNLSVLNLSPGKYRHYTKRQLLSTIGMSDTGELLPAKHKNKNSFGNIGYISQKKTIRPPKKIFSHDDSTNSADDQAFIKFRKETYFEVLKGIQDKRVAEEKERAERAERGPELT
jgi:23S rRNA pseudouridine2605 synthase